MIVGIGFKRNSGRPCRPAQGRSKQSKRDGNVRRGSGDPPHDSLAQNGRKQGLFWHPGHSRPVLQAFGCKKSPKSAIFGRFLLYNREALPYHRIDWKGLKHFRIVLFYQESPAWTGDMRSSLRKSNKTIGDLDG
jgi:hypothetical protein